MLTVRTNEMSTLACNQLNRANNCIKTSLERLSTGYKINSAKDDAANLAISKGMDCQISGDDVALDNTQQGINLLQIADGALDTIQNNVQRMRDLCLQAMNGTYSNEEKVMIQSEINQLIEEIYRQRNSTKYNDILIFGASEEVPATNAAIVAGTHAITPLTETEALAQGYTCIHDEAEFLKIKDNTSGKYCLMGNIDFSKVSSWGTLFFKGEINGNGYSINNYSSTNSGLIYVNNGTIKNLNMNNININSSANFATALVSYNDNGTIDNCSSSGTINGADYAAGLVGYNSKGTISNCSSSATVNAGTYTGGLVGYNDNGTINNCASSSTITADVMAGGLLGYNDNGIVDKCLSSGVITGTQGTGGLIGYTYLGEISNSLSSGLVTGTNEYTGGLIGYSLSANVDNCSSSATVTGSSYTGGLMSVNYAGTVNNSSCTGTVTGTEDNTGGLVGLNYGVLTNCFSSATVTGATATGGLVGQNNAGSIDNCSSSGTVGGAIYVGGLVGYNISGSIDNSSSSTTVNADRYAGGLLGYNKDGNINNSSSSGASISTDYAGGFIAYNSSGTINNCSSAGNVTGHICVGGFAAVNSGSIDKSYSTGDVSGFSYIGGITGYNIGDINNSYSLGDVSGTHYVAGAVAYNVNGGSINNSYVTGTVEGESNTFAFLASSFGLANISNCYATADLPFASTSATISNSHGRIEQAGVTAHDESWFKIGNNLSFLGSAFDTSVNPPDIIGNERYDTSVQFQVGANSGEDNRLTVDVGFSMNGFTVNVTTSTAAEESLDNIDKFLNRISSKRSEVGASQNRLEGVTQALSTTSMNLQASRSTIVDTDFAKETANLTKNQILQNITASLVAQANTAPELALSLLQ